ncbi:16200_t:CDS:2, partial [Dentiscutata heterogama]
MAKSSENTSYSTLSTSSNIEYTYQDNQPNNNIIPPVSNNIKNAQQSNQPNNNTQQSNQLDDNTHLVKRKRSEEFDDLFVKANQDENLSKSNNTAQKNSIRNRKKGKETTTRTTRNAEKKQYIVNSFTEIQDSDK